MEILAYAKIKLQKVTEMKYFNPETKIFQESSLLTGLPMSSDEAIICVNEKVIKGPTYGSC